MTSRLHLAGLEMDALPGWLDITAELEPNSPPTLARRDGIGALQFSFARYIAGKKPQIEADDLKQLLFEFEQREGLPQASETQSSPHTLVATYETNEELLKAWYVTDGASVVFVTYVALLPAKGDLAKELVEASLIVDSVSISRVR